jgi:hypothetical protein
VFLNQWGLMVSWLGLEMRTSINDSFNAKVSILLFLHAKQTLVVQGLPFFQFQNLFLHTWYVFLDRGSAHHKASTYKGQHRKESDVQPCPK